MNRARHRKRLCKVAKIQCGGEGSVMIQVSLVSPSAIVYKLDHPTLVVSGTAPRGMPIWGSVPNGMVMHFFGVVVADSVPIGLLRIQLKQTLPTSWKLFVTDGKNTYEFTKVWFYALAYPASGQVGKFRVDFASHTGPRSLKLKSP
jgi:hypothetical protein